MEIIPPLSNLDKPIKLSQKGFSLKDPPSILLTQPANFGNRLLSAGRKYSVSVINLSRRLDIRPIFHTYYYIALRQTFWVNTRASLTNFPKQAPYKIVNISALERVFIDKIQASRSDIAAKPKVKSSSFNRKSSAASPNCPIS